ncbi:unnamed protein product [Nesidiocoris tenuis]|uniref:Deltamethrin resistance protein prag01 domain-containing protein n=1 Tax=Nesidiocoris tenuis TaxID=355587 RepID=A0A6H5H2J0_9HEMI|nr:unnamed protein product [Nesidiocoris tenuis]
MSGLLFKMTRMYHDIEHRQPTMDDLPVPQGSWEAQYKANQAKYNVHLLLGIAFFSVTLITAKATGLIYLNWAPPKLD